MFPDIAKEFDKPQLTDDEIARQKKVLDEQYVDAFGLVRRVKKSFTWKQRISYCFWRMVYGVQGLLLGATIRRRVKHGSAK